MKVWLLCLAILLFAHSVRAQDQEAVSVFSGQPAMDYQAGDHASNDYAVEVTPETDQVIHAIDLTKFTDPTVCALEGIEGTSDAGRTWRLLTFGTFCGQKDGFKARDGTPLSAGGGILLGKPGVPVVRSFLRIFEGGHLETSTTIQLREKK